MPACLSQTWTFPARTLCPIPTARSHTTTTPDIPIAGNDVQSLVPPPVQRAAGGCAGQYRQGGSERGKEKHCSDCREELRLPYSVAPSVKQSRYRKDFTNAKDRTVTRLRKPDSDPVVRTTMGDLTWSHRVIERSSPWRKRGAGIYAGDGLWNATRLQARSSAEACNHDGYCMHLHL